MAIEGQEVEEIALLGLLEGPEEPGLDEQGAGQEQRHRSEDELPARARAREDEHEPEDRPGNEHEPRGVEQDEQVHAGALEERQRVDPDVDDALVVGENARRARPRASRSAARRTEPSGRTCSLRAARSRRSRRPDEEDRAQEAGGQDHELDAGEGGQAAEGDERELRAPRGPLERGDAGRDSGENERVGEGLRDHPRGVDEVREHERERGDAERDARRQAEPPREPVDGNRPPATWRARRSSAPGDTRCRRRSRARPAR